MEKDVVERLREYVKASEVTANGKSKHCQDCRDAISEIESLRKLFIVGLGDVLKQAKKNDELISDAKARLDRAGL